MSVAKPAARASPSTHVRPPKGETPVPASASSMPTEKERTNNRSAPKATAVAAATAAS